MGSALAGGRRGHALLGWRARAAVVRQVLDQAVHRIEVGAVADMATLAFALHQAGLHQLLQVEAERGWGHLQGRGDVARHATCRASLHQQAEGSQAGGMAQGSQGSNCIQRFHISRIIE